MDRNKIKKTITPKRIDDFLLQQEHLKQDKHFHPGKVQFTNTEHCTARVVNFFGDVRTEVFVVKTHPNDREVAVGCSNGQVKVYDIQEGKVLTIGNTSRMSGFPCTSIRWKPVTNNDFMACNCDGSIKWYNKSSEAAYGHFEKSSSSYLCADYQIKQEWCLFGTDHNTIELFDNETMKPTKIYEAGGPSQLNFNHHTNRVFCVKCLPDDPQVFFSGGWDSTVQVWDVRVGSGSVRKICGPSISADSLDIKHGVLLTGNYQNSDIAQLYDFGSGKLIQSLNIGEPRNSQSYCYTASFAHRSEHDLIALGLSGSNKVKLLNRGVLACEMKFQAAPFSLDFHRFNNKDYLIVGGVQGTIYSIRIDITK